MTTNSLRLGAVAMLVLGVVAGCVYNGGPMASANAEEQARSRAGKDGRTLYEDNCAACHGVDGRGRSKDAVGFDYPLPDFTDCGYATPERTVDWAAFAHEGGPIRGFSPIMPAFGDALTVDELVSIVTHIHAFCADPTWAPGELNFPRPLYTEKAFPENEMIVSSRVETDGSSENRWIYSRRFGSRSSVELTVPYVNLDTGSPGHWQQGVGDIAVAFKRQLGFNAARGYIVSAAAELGLPTGNKDNGIGAGHATLETFLAAGKELPREFFVQGRAIYAMPLDGSEREAALQVALGRSMPLGGTLTGRLFTPMVEVLGARTLARGEKLLWDWVPQFQITLNQRQHVRASVGVRLPLTDSAHRDPQYSAYLLWDMGEGGLLEGWNRPRR